jgi:CubicO group peptidase (beta-lactamase class C family)
MPPSIPTKTALGARLAPYVERGEVPGLVALVTRNGREQVEVLGVKTLGKSDPVQRDSIFRIASMTKPITAVATMLLVEEGKLRLDEPVERLLPELANRKVLRRLESPLDDVVPARRSITVLDLLTFRMGFGLLMAPPGTYPIQKATEELELGQHSPMPAEPKAPDEWLRRFGTLPLMYQPGERWMYNTGSDVLGVLIARAAGTPFDVFLRERLFEPLGMRDTDFSVPASKLERFLPSYMVNPSTNALTVFDSEAGQWSRPPAFPSGAAGLVSTADDFSKFAKLLLENGELGGRRFLSPATVKELTCDHLTPENKAFGALTPGYFDGHGWGFGMAVLTATDEFGRAAGSYGWDGGLGTGWYNDPARNLSAILLTQRAFSSPAPPPIFREFWQTVSGAS